MRDEKEATELRPGKYIVHGARAHESRDDLKKIQIMEVTRTSIAYKNLDGSGYVFRLSKKAFNETFKIVEIL